MGERGFFVLEIQKNKLIRREFIKNNSRTYHIIDVDISALNNTLEIELAIKKATNKIPSDDIVRLKLTGKYDYELIKDINALREYLESKFYYAELIDDSKVNLNTIDFANEVSLRGEFFRLIEASNYSPEVKEELLSLIHILTYSINNYLTLDDSLNDGYKKFENYAKSVLPVLDDDMKIVGIVTADDVLNIMVAEHEEDIAKMTGVGDYDESSNAFRRSIQRMPWLVISVLLNLVIAALLSVFEKTLVEVIALIMFQPMILGMAGNIGTQSIAVTILKLNQDELAGIHNEKKHIGKELAIGVLNSITIGLGGFLLSFLILSFINMGTHSPLLRCV